MARHLAHRRAACGGRSDLGRGHRRRALGVDHNADTDPITSTADQDDKYIQALNDKGISFANPGAAIYNGKTVCQNLGQGMTVQEVVSAFRASSPAFSDNANDFVAISVRAYCPQHSNLVAGF
jgi:hypothetical protein